jgi:ribulose-phosphate 3-epimerase
MKKIAPSILSADFTRLGQEITSVVEAGADYIHIDVMDGHFVPNLTIGPLVVKAVKPVSNVPLDVHLMISRPDLYIEEFVKAGADIISVHAESTAHLHRTLGHIRSCGARAAVALNPGTPICVLDHLLTQLDMVLIMSVNPGFEAQKFIPEMIPKIKSLREKIDKSGLNIEIEVDGGVNHETIESVSCAGADVFVAGSAIYHSENYSETIQVLRRNMG